MIRDHGLEGDARWHPIAAGRIGPGEITKVGKECHNRCPIYYLAGDCIMPREGVFARVLQDGNIHCEDIIRIVEKP